MRVPLAQSGPDELLLYEMTMDGMGQPDMYVAYHDAQIHPEYHDSPIRNMSQPLEIRRTSHERAKHVRGTPLDLDFGVFNS
jgi:hypothetical protein